MAGDLLAAGAEIVGQRINAISTGLTNRANRRWQEKMYNRQRTDALSDWSMQNTYNAPQAQMERLKAAKLNPNLVYGSGTVAGNSSTNIRSSSPGSYEGKAPQFDGGRVVQAMNTYYDTEVKKATIDNLKATNDVILQDKILKEAETANILQNTDTSKFDLGFKTDLRDTNISAAKSGVARTQAETNLMDTDARVKNAMLKPNVDKVLQDILLEKKDIALKSSQMNLNSSQMQKIDAEMDKIIADTHLVRTESGLKDLQLKIDTFRQTSKDYASWIKPFTDALISILRYSGAMK